MSSGRTDTCTGAQSNGFSCEISSCKVFETLFHTPYNCWSHLCGPTDETCPICVAWYLSQSVKVSPGWNCRWMHGKRQDQEEPLLSALVSWA